MSSHDTEGLVADAAETGEKPLENEHTVPPIQRRITGVLIEPVATFRSLEPGWGLVAPWAAIAAAGLLFALVHFAQVDATALANRRWAYQQTLLPDQQRRALAQTESTINIGKWGGFATRLADLMGPTAGAVIAIVVVGLLLFGGSALLGGKKDLLRAMVVAAHAKLVAIVGYACCTIGLVLGNPEPATSASSFADALAHPVVATLLSILDPIALWHAALLGIGLAVSLGVKPRRAAAFAGALTLLPWLAGVGLAALSLLQQRS